MGDLSQRLSEALSEAFQGLGFSMVKPEQKQIVEGLLQQDVFVVLPTGFGKSACFQCLPALFDMLAPSGGPSIVVVVAPLTAIMKDQVAALSKAGMKACYITGEQDDNSIKEDVEKGLYQLVYFTPEILIQSKRWRQLLSSEVYSNKLRAFVIDEAHTVTKWGSTFRKLLLRIGEVRSLLPPHVNIMAMTATATAKLRTDVSRLIGLRNELVVARSPSKLNITYTVEEFISIEKTLDEVALKIREEGAKSPRIIIYCQTYDDCASLYLYFRRYLGSGFTTPPGAPDLPRFRLVDMYMGCTESAVKDEIIDLFCRESPLRLVVATVAFGMGIDCPNIRKVMHYGCPTDIESYVQETGRAGRDGLHSIAVLVKKGNAGRRLESNMQDYVSNKSLCRRDTLFRNFDGYIHNFDGPLCLCCDVCCKSCKCLECKKL